MLEGREPRGLHPSQTYEPGDKNFILINTAPEHAKSTTISINYATWRICKDPNVRILFASKTQEMAKQMMWAIKSRLTHPRYLNLQMDFGPPGGWRADADVWSADKVYLGSERDSSEKDPTMRAVGLGGQIYGSRLDLALVDDAVVLSNAHEYEKQIRWLQQELITRGHPNSVVAVVGTRVDPVDLYAELRNPDRYPSGESPWTYLTQPFVFALRGFQTTELEPWEESGQHWRRLRVAWPNYLATHCTEQTLYFTSDGLLARHDYDVEISGGTNASHFVSDYVDVAGIRVPTKHRIFPRTPDGQSLAEPLIVSIDLSEISFT